MSTEGHLRGYKVVFHTYAAGDILLAFVDDKLNLVPLSPFGESRVGFLRLEGEWVNHEGQLRLEVLLSALSVMSR